MSQTEGLQRIAMGVEYNGAPFCGWQRQVKQMTVQATLEAALSQVANHPVETICAGRTDRSVHGVGQVIHFDTEAKRSLHAWLMGVNSNLPKSIRIRWVRPVVKEFHARFSALSRTYGYFFYNNSVASAIFATQCSWIREPLDLDKMQLGAQCLVGTHDFSAFRAAQCQAKSPQRTVHYVRLQRVSSTLLFLEIKANGFLHHMVRNIVGTLLPIGLGEKPITWCEEVLTNKERKQAGITAVGDGLYLLRVEYPEEFQLPQQDFEYDVGNWL